MSMSMSPATPEPNYNDPDRMQRLLENRRQFFEDTYEKNVSQLDAAIAEQKAILGEVPTVEESSDIAGGGYYIGGTYYKSKAAAESFTGYDPASVAAARENLAKLQAEKARLETEYAQGKTEFTGMKTDIGVYRTQLSYVNAPFSEREQEIISQGQSLTPEQAAKAREADFAAQPKVGTFTFMPGMFSSVPVTEQGTRVQSPRGEIELITTIGRGIPGPGLGARPGSIGADLQKRMGKLIAQTEQPFEGVTFSLSEMGAGMMGEAGSLKMSGDARSALYASGVVAAGVAAGAFDRVTFPIRPGLWAKTAGAIASLVTNPVETARMASSQFMRTPLYSTGYVAGSVLAMKVSVPVAERIYSYIAPKTPLLRTYYYSKMFPETSSYAEFNLPKTEVGGSYEVGAIKYLKQSKAASSFAPFRETLLSPAKTPITIAEVGQLFSKVRPNLSAVKFLSIPGVSTDIAALYPHSSYFTSLTASNIRGGLKFLTIPGVETDLASFAPPHTSWYNAYAGSPSPTLLGTMRSNLKFASIAKPAGSFPQFRGVLINPARTPGFSGIMPKTIVNLKQSLKFLSTPGVSTDIASFHPHSSMWNLPKPSEIPTYRSVRSQNRGFSRIDSGIVGRVTTRYERNMSNFFRTTFAEPPVEGSTRLVSPALSYAKQTRGPWGEPALDYYVEIAPIYSALFRPTVTRTKYSNELLASPHLTTRQTIREKAQITSRSKLDLKQRQPSLQKSLTDVRSNLKLVTPSTTQFKLKTRFDTTYKVGQIPALGQYEASVQDLKKQNDQVTAPKLKTPQLQIPDINVTRVVAKTKWRKPLQLETKHKKRKKKGKAGDLGIYEMRWDKIMNPGKAGRIRV